MARKEARGELDSKCCGVGSPLGGGGGSSSFFGVI